MLRLTKVNHRISRLDEHLTKLLYWKDHPHIRLQESLSDWADCEVALACQGEDGYGVGCYKSALKAFHSLMDDGHSGFSIGLTKQILNRLIDGKPLKPIMGNPNEWNECGGFDRDGKAEYQNSRMSAFFKSVYPDGRVEYHDVDRTVLIEVEDDGTETSWHSGLASRLVDEIVGPIELPYMPPDTPYKVYAKQFDSVNAEVGCFDTTHVIKIVDPDGNTIPCERFYAETERDMEEISKEEYIRRRLSYEKALLHQS